MSNSTDSLRKKVCVTVFLDELFEEVLEEDLKDTKQVKKAPDSEVKTDSKSHKKASVTRLDTDEKLKTTPKAHPEQSQAQLRPRKPRTLSKFSKNHKNAAFKDELSKYEYGSYNKKPSPPVESSVSESDFDFNEILRPKKLNNKNIISSFSELSKADLTDESFFNLNSSTFSSQSIFCSKNLLALSKSATRCLACNKSTQFDGAISENEKPCQKSDTNTISFKDDEDATENVLSWKNTQTEIYLLLTKPKSSELEKETCERDCMRNYNLASILKNCMKTEEKEVSADVFQNFGDLHSKPSTDDESDARTFSDSYTCVFLQNKEPSKSVPEVKRLWTSTKENMWDDGFESDASESKYTNYADEIGLQSFQKDSLIFYTLCLKSRRSVYRKAGNGAHNDNYYDYEDDDDDGFDDDDDDDFDYNDNSDDYNDYDDYKDKEEGENYNIQQLVPDLKFVSKGGSSFLSIKCKAAQKPNVSFRPVTHLSSKLARGSKMKLEEKARNETSVPKNKPENLPSVEDINKSFAEGDTFEKSFHQGLKYILDVQEKKTLIVCDGLLKQMPQAKVIHNEIIVNRAEVELLGEARGEVSGEQSNPKKPEISSHSFSVSEPFAQVYFKQRNFGNFEGNLTDAESEITFADSENFYEYEDIFCEKRSDFALTARCNSPASEVCFVKVQNKLSDSRTLGRRETVEILGGNLWNVIKKVSAEVVLVCENISNSEVYPGPRNSSPCTRENHPKISECYLKDSTDSAMYLIEVPLHFIHTNIKKPKSDHFFQAFNSD